MNLSDRDYSEKRDFIRMRMDHPVTLTHAKRQYSAMCLDLSSTGMQIKTTCPLSLDDRVHLYIPSGNLELKDLEAQAEVVRVQTLEDGSHLVGLSITYMT